MMEVLLRILGGLVPDHTADPEVQYRYQLRLGLTVSIVVLWVLAVTITAFGIVPAWSQGFAMTTDMKQVVTEIRQNRAQTIDNQLLDLRIKHCEAKDDVARQLYWSKIAPLLAEYQQITGRPYNLPACADL
jgi:hypothetical protein